MDTLLLQLDPQPYLWRLAFLGLIFSFIALAVFLLLTGRGARFQGGGGLLPNTAALAIVLPVWLASLSWRYHAEFGGRFFELHRTDPDSYTLVYVYPERRVTIKAEDIVAWRGPTDWTEKLPGRRIEIDLIDGATHRSARLYTADYEKVRERFAAADIDLPSRP